MSKTKPITDARRAAASANGAKSKGPVTTEGKAKSAFNAVTHGLTSNVLVLTTESREKMDDLHQAYRAEYQPQGQTASDIVDELTAAKWLQRHCWAMQSALLDITMDRMEPEIQAEFTEIDNAARTALALLNRSAARHARDYHRAPDKLRLIQRGRGAGGHVLQNHDRQGVNLQSPNEPAKIQPNPLPSTPHPLVSCDFSHLAVPTAVFPKSL